MAHIPNIRKRVIYGYYDASNPDPDGTFTFRTKKNDQCLWHIREDTMDDEPMGFSVLYNRNGDLEVKILDLERELAREKEKNEDIQTAIDILRRFAR